MNRQVLRLAGGLRRCGLIRAKRERLLDVGCGLLSADSAAWVVTGNSRESNSGAVVLSRHDWGAAGETFSPLPEGEFTTTRAVWVALPLYGKAIETGRQITLSSRSMDEWLESTGGGTGQDRVPHLVSVRKLAGGRLSSVILVRQPGADVFTAKDADLLGLI